MFLRSLTRTNAAKYSMYAVAPMVLGIGAAAWVAQSEPVDYSRRVAEEAKPFVPPAPAEGTSKPAPDPALEGSQVSGATIAARFDSIKNRPVPIKAEEAPIEDTTTTVTPSPQSDIKYVGPVRLGPVMLAILNVEGKQMSVGKGKTFSYTVDSEPHSAKVVGVTETEVTLDENGKERVIARAERAGDVVSYVGGKPNRSKSIVLKKKTAGGKGGGEHPLDSKAAADYQNKKAIAMERFAPMLDKIAKEKNQAIASQLRDKIMASMKAEGLDPGEIDDEISRMKETGGEK